MVIKIKNEVLKMFESSCKRLLNQYSPGKDYDCGLTYKDNKCPVLKHLNGECPTLDTYEEGLDYL